MAITCSVCDKLFSNQSNLNKHRKRNHKLKPKIVSYDQSKYMYKCLEKNCGTSFRHNVGLKNHLTDEHEIQINCEEMEFSNKEDFLTWKKSTEKMSQSRYVLKSTSKFKTKPVKYYLCNRSGRVQTKSLNKRRPKSQGSCKLNRNCISMIKVIEGEKLLVTWIKTHYGHELDLQHIRLPEMDKSVVASKLALGVPPSRILDSYRDKIDEENLTREDLITRKDIRNIKTAYRVKISEGVKHDNDAMSVNLLVNQCEQEGNNNCILYYEQQEIVLDEEWDMNLSERNEESNILKKNFSTRLLRTMSKLENRKNTLDDEVILQIQRQLDVIDKLIGLPAVSSTESFVPVDCNEPVNKKIKKQNKFFSTKKKRKTTRNQCKKPIFSETLEISSDLKSNFKQLYVLSNSSLEHNYSV